jgi:hypothetical protein
VTAASTSVLVPGIVTLVLRPLTLGLFNYLPAGPTPIIFAILAQYHAMVPHVYKYKVATSTSATTNEQAPGLTFSDKSYRYLLAVQLALSQWPGSLLGAAAGWLVGYAWRMEVLPRSVTRWRIPSWMVGMRAPRRSEEFEGLRRSSATASASGVQGQTDADGGRRRGLGPQLVDRFDGAF